MPFQIVQANILHVPCEAIINPTDEWFSGSGGLDAQLHQAAGPALREYCGRLLPLQPGKAEITPAFNVPCKCLIHTVAPWWTERESDLEQLRRCYRSALSIAERAGLAQLAFPLIGLGTRGFPKEQVLRIAAEELQAYLLTHEDCFISLVVHDRTEFLPDTRLLAGVEHWLRANQCFDAGFSTSAPRPFEAAQSPREACADDEDVTSARAERPRAQASAWPASAQMKAEPRFVLDESFSQMLMRKIDEKGFRKDSECYLRANIDRKLFSKIRCDENYHPKKTTAVALAVALELPLRETRELLVKAGYSLSPSILFDVIVEYCISERIYDVFIINELLFQYDQPLLGG